MDVLGSPNSNLEEDRETVRDVHLPPRQSSREDEFVVPSSIAGATGVGCTLPPDLSDRVSNSLALALSPSPSPSPSPRNVPRKSERTNKWVNTQSIQT